MIYILLLGLIEMVNGNIWKKVLLFERRIIKQRPEYVGLKTEMFCCDYRVLLRHWFSECALGLRSLSMA